MLKYLNTFLVATLLFFSGYEVFSQSDCILGVGFTKDSVLIEVFQLNTLQSEKLVDYSAEVAYRYDILENKLKNIRKRHPQSTVSELSKLATEYNIVIDSMSMVQTMIDKKLLKLFNEKQYILYRNLCKEASKSPFIVIPAVYNDSLDAKKRSPLLNNLPDRN